MPIYLTGLPGSGKSRMAAKLSELLGIPFFDLDFEIEKKSGKPVSSIFQAEGEAQFRVIENGLLKDFIRTGQFILATGGGTPCFFDNMDMMLKAGKVVFLNPPLIEIVLRLEKLNRESRPIIGIGVNLAKRLDELYRERLVFYSKAHLTYAGTSAAELAEILQS